MVVPFPFTSPMTFHFTKSTCCFCLSTPPLTVCAFIFLTFTPPSPPHSSRSSCCSCYYFYYCYSENEPRRRGRRQRRAIKPPVNGESRPLVELPRPTSRVAELNLLLTQLLLMLPFTRHQELTNSSNKLHRLPFDFIILTLCVYFTVVQGSFHVNFVLKNSL